MKIEFHIKNIVISAKQKALMEKKLHRLKRYVKDEPMTVDVYLKDETSPEKGGIDQAVEISATFAKEKFFVREVDDRMLRAFAIAHKSIERNLSRFHKKRIDESHKGTEGYVTKALRALKIRK